MALGRNSETTIEVVERLQRRAWGVVGHAGPARDEYDRVRFRECPINP